MLEDRGNLKGEGARSGRTPLSEKIIKARRGKSWINLSHGRDREGGGRTSSHSDLSKSRKAGNGEGQEAKVMDAG